jgi:hypothetical protein
MDYDYSRSIFFNQLEKELPPVFTRNVAANLLGGLFSAHSLRNLDSKKKGPQVKIRFGRKVAYEKENFLKWLKNYKFCDSNFS